MAFHEAPRQVFEFEAGANDDPDCSRTAAVLAAYLRAEQMRALRQLLWPHLAALAIGWLAVGAWTALLSRVAVAGGLLLLLALAVAAALAEWRASETLIELLRVHSAIVRTQPSRPSVP